MSIELTAVRARVEKAAAIGAMTTAEQVAFFDDVDRLLKSHAKKRHPELSSEQAFVRELNDDDSFRTIVRKSQELQEELNSG